MDKTVNAGDNLCECAEGCDAYDSNVNNIAFVIFSNKLVPGVVLFLLVAQGNSLLLGVEALYIYIELVTYLNDLSGVLDYFRCELA